jgi:RNA polymerase sigma factor (sigma-70 family)
MSDNEMNKMLSKPYINSKEMLELVGKYQRARKQENKDRLRDEIFENNVRMIRREVFRHSSIKPDEVEDAFNICVLNFLYGLDKFDLKRNVALSTYMMYWIKKGIQDFMYSRNIVSIGQGAFRVDSTKQQALSAGNKVLLYLDGATYIESQEKVIESFYDPFVNGDPEKEIMDKLQSEQLFEIVNKNLTKREAIIIRFKYFEDIKWSSADFKPVLKISYSMIDIIERKALFKLRKLLQNKDISDLFPEDGRTRPQYIPTEEELQINHDKVRLKVGHGKGMPGGKFV